MITLHYPDVSQHRVAYARHHGSNILLGPFRRDGLPVTDLVTKVRLPIDHKPTGKYYQSILGSWWPRPSLFGENPTSHRKTSGDIHFLPFDVSSLHHWSERHNYSAPVDDPQSLSKSLSYEEGAIQRYVKRNRNTSWIMSLTGSFQARLTPAKTNIIVFNVYTYNGNYVVSTKKRSAGPTDYFGFDTETIRFDLAKSIKTSDFSPKQIALGGPDAVRAMLEGMEIPFTERITRGDQANLPALFPTVSQRANLPEPHTVISKISSLIQSPLVKDAYPELKDESDLVMEAAASNDALSANMIAFVRDLKDVKSLIPKLKNLGSLKTHASNYLGVQYGILPTVSDLDAIVAAFTKHTQVDSAGNTVLSAGFSTTKTHRNITVEGTSRARLLISNEDSRFGDFVTKLRSSGFYPSPQNLWDLVPYSFVIDWFVDIGSFLEDIDDRMRLAQMPILATTTSRRYSIDPSEYLARTFPDLFIDIRHVVYKRRVHKSPPTKPLSFDSEVTAHNHTIEGAALILTRQK